MCTVYLWLFFSVRFSRMRLLLLSVACNAPCVRTHSIYKQRRVWLERYRMGYGYWVPMRSALVPNKWCGSREVIYKTAYEHIQFPDIVLAARTICNYACSFMLLFPCEWKNKNALMSHNSYLLLQKNVPSNFLKIAEEFWTKIKWIISIWSINKFFNITTDKYELR